MEVFAGIRGELERGEFFPVTGFAERCPLRPEAKATVAAQAQKKR